MTDSVGTLVQVLIAARIARYGIARQDIRMRDKGAFGQPSAIGHCKTRAYLKTELQARIAQLDVAGTIAAVRLEIDDWTGHRFAERFNLLKVDGEWKIMNEVFYLHL